MAKIQISHNPTINIPQSDGSPSYDSARTGVSFEVETDSLPGTPEFDAAVKQVEIAVKYLYLKRLAWELGFVQTVRDLGIAKAMENELIELGILADQ